MTDAGDGATESEEGAEGSPPPAEVGDDGLSIDRAEMIQHVQERADRLRRQEVDTALRKLEASGDVTDAQREAVEEMARGIVEGLLSTPEAAMREADEYTLRAALRVYGIDPDGADDQKSRADPDQKDGNRN